MKSFEIIMAITILLTSYVGQPLNALKPVPAQLSPSIPTAQYLGNCDENMALIESTTQKVAEAIERLNNINFEEISEGTNMADSLLRAQENSLFYANLLLNTTHGYWSLVDLSPHTVLTQVIADRFRQEFLLIKAKPIFA